MWTPEDLSGGDESVQTSLGYQTYTETVIREKGLEFNPSAGTTLPVCWLALCPMEVFMGVNSESLH